jgi:DNA-binding CsgD family transcriptional regulator
MIYFCWTPLVEYTLKHICYRITLLLFSCVLISFSSGALMNAEQGVSRIVSEHENQGISFVQLFENYNQSDFSTIKEWNHFLKLLCKEDKITETEEYPELCYRIGQRLSDAQKHREAYYFFYITLKEERDVYSSPKPYIASFHEMLGQSYYFFRRFDLSEKHLKIALHHPKISETSKIKIYNTLSLIYRDKQDNKTSEYYLQKAYNQAVKLKDEAWTGILSGNLGYIAWKNQEHEKARKLIEFDYYTSTKGHQKSSQVNALALLIELDLTENKLAESTLKMKVFDSLMKQETNPQLWGTYYRTKITYYEKLGQYEMALKSFRKYISYKEINDEKRQFLNIQNAEFQIEFERKQGENNIYKEKKKTDDLIILGLFVICLIVGLTSFIIIKQIQRKRKQDKELLTLRAQKMEDELHATEREMRALLSTMFDKNKVIFELQEQVETFEKNQHSRTDSEKEAMLNDLQSFSLLTENDWIEFKRLFEKLNPGFFDFFQERFPEITAAEIRLAALIKLNLSNLEMARTLAISPDSVRKTNLRLRKKLNIESLDDLTRFIKSI